MYLELFFTGIKTERQRDVEVPKIAYLGIEASGKDCVGIIRKMVYAGFEGGRMRDVKYKSCRAKMVYLGIEAGKKYFLGRD